MRIQVNTLFQESLSRIPAKARLAVISILCLAVSIWATSSSALASSSEYGLTAGSVTLDGANNSSVTLALKTSVARSYVAIQGTWSAKETASTSYFSLSNMSRGGSTAITFGANGTCAWTPENGAGMSVAAGGEVLSATYTVDKDTPAGTYNITFSNGLFTYDVNGSDVDENDIISSTATITVTRSEPTGSNTSTTDSDTSSEPNSQTDHDQQTDSDTATEGDTSTDDDTSSDHDTETDTDTKTDHNNSAVRNKSVDSVKVADSDARNTTDPSSSEKLKINISLLIALIISFAGLALVILLIYRKKFKK